jgi:hypothetical protein
MIQSDELGKNVNEPTFSLRSVTPPDARFGQYASEVPSGIKTTVLSPRVQMTKRSKPREIKRTPVLASYFLNPPFKDGLFSVSRMYRAIEPLALNYQNTHQDAFFEAYPQLLILSDSEKGKDYSTSYLRRNYKTYVKRLAHYYYQYLEGSKLYTGSLLNLLRWSTVNGVEPFKDLAFHFRWSLINSNTAYFSRFPAGSGVTQKMASCTAIATGDTTFGAEIFAIPIWVTDIFGNRGNHAPDFASLVNESISLTSNSSSVADYDVSTIGLWLGNVHNDSDKEVDAAPTIEAGRARQLYSNMYSALSQYSFQQGRVHSPRIENGGTYAFQLSYNQNTTENVDVENIRWVSKSNLDGSVFSTDTKDATVRDNIIDNLWDSYHLWEKYMITHFSEMTDPNNDLHRFAINQIKICQYQQTPADLLKCVRDLPTVSATSLAEKMVYKKDNAVNTATLCKFIPIFNPGEDTSSSVSPFTNRFEYSSDDVFQANFERYDVTNSNAADMIAKSMVYPHLTPSVFTTRAQLNDAAGLPSGTLEDQSDLPFVVNCVNTTGAFLEPMLSQSLDGREPMGKYATYIDLASSSSIAPELTAIEAMGVPSSYAESYIQNGNGIVFNEYPSMIFVEDQPIIDSTDIYQSGFSILISANDEIGNEWSDHFTNLSNYLIADTTVPIDSYPGSELLCGFWPSLTGETINAWTTPVITPNAAGATGEILHVANQNYLKAVGHTLVFVGGAIFNHPWLRFAAPETGLPSFAFFDYRDMKSSQLKVADQVTYSLFKKAGETTITAGSDDFFKMWWHSAMLVDYAGASSLKEVYHSGAEIAYQSIINDLFDGNDDRGNANAILFLFDPCYGAVQPIVKQLPYAAYAAANLFTAPCNGSDPTLDHPGDYGSDSQMAKYNGRVSPTLGDTILNCDIETVGTTSAACIEDSLKGGLYTDMTTAPYYYLYWLRHVKWASPIMDSTTGSFTIEQKPCQVFFDSSAKWPLTLSAMSLIQFTGIEDADYYWNKMKEIDNSNDFSTVEGVSTGDPIPRDETVVEPKRTPAFGSPARSITSGGNNSSSVTHHVQSSTSSTGGVSNRAVDDGRVSKPSKAKSKSYKKRSSKRNGDKFGANANTKRSASTVVSKQAERNRFSTAPNVAPDSSVTSSFDASSKSFDKDFDKRSRKLIRDGAALQQSE